MFIRWLVEGLTQSHAAELLGVSSRTLERNWTPYWCVQALHCPDQFRIYDQVFIDGTYFSHSCLLVMTSNDHVIAWKWCLRESKHAYLDLLTQIQPPRIVTLDGHRGSLAAVQQVWPETRIQRCVVHVQRNVQRATTLRPRYKQGKVLLQLARKLTSISTVDEAVEWIKQLDQFYGIYGDWLEHKTFKKDVSRGEIPSFARKNKTWWYTHYRYRSAYKLLERLVRRNELFTYLDPALVKESDESLAATTNIVESKNAVIKGRVFQHRGMSPEHQRTMTDWILLSMTQSPPDPLEVAKSQGWGMNAYDQARTHTPTENLADHETGRPALYDNHIDSEYTHSIGIRKGQI